MQTDSKPINFMLITDNLEKAAKLKKFLTNNGRCGAVSQMTPGKQALQAIKQSGQGSGPFDADLIMIDFAEPLKRVLMLVQEAVFRRRSSIVASNTTPTAPIVLLTSPSSERLLEDGTVDCGTATMFTPKTLAGFVRKTREHHREHFLHAVSVLSALGPILVRQPASFARRQHAIRQVA